MAQSIVNPVPKPENALTRPRQAVCSTWPLSPDAERTAANLRAGLSEQEQVVAIAGFGMEDGGSTLAWEVAIALSQLDESRVILVDGNFTAPSIGSISGTGAAPGLLDVIEGPARLDEAVCPSDIPNLFVLPAGHSTSRDAALVSSVRCRMTVRELARQNRFVIVSAGDLSAPATLGLVSTCDAAIVSLRAGSRRRDDLVELNRWLSPLKTRMLGVILAVNP